MSRTPSRLRLLGMAAALAALGAVMLACDHTATQPLSGPAPPPNPHAREVDTFAFDAIASARWKIDVGVIAAYYLQTAGSMRGRALIVGHTAPGRVAPRLLTDTLVIADSLTGPPIGTDLITPTYLTFDRSGNLWLSVAGAHGTGNVIQYSRAQTSQNGSLFPSITLTGLQTPLGLTFDGSGNLWVVDSEPAQLKEYMGLTLSTGGTPASAVSLSGISASGATWTPVGVAADPKGNLWVSAQPRTRPAGPAADSVPAYVVAEFTDSAIKAGGTPSPALTLVQAGVHPGGYGPGVAFDPAGNLWTANANLGTATQFTTQSLVPNGNPAPAVTLTSPAFSGASDIAFDAAGVMYAGGGIAGGPGPGFSAFAPPAIVATGSPSPKLVFTAPTGANHFAIR